MNASIAKGHRREWLPFVWEDPGGPGSGHEGGWPRARGRLRKRWVVLVLTMVELHGIAWNYTAKFMKRHWFRTHSCCDFTWVLVAQLLIFVGWIHGRTSRLLRPQPHRWLRPQVDSWIEAGTAATILWVDDYSAPIVTPIFGEHDVNCLFICR